MELFIGLVFAAAFAVFGGLHLLLSLLVGIVTIFRGLGDPTVWRHYQKVTDKTVPLYLDFYKDLPIRALMKFQEVAPLYGWSHQEILAVIEQAASTKDSNGLLSVLRLYCR